MTPERQFADLLAADASRPFVTYYDEASGERSELSAKSLANWVAKTHHLLTDELGLGVGDSALIALPAHWISVPVLLGCLTAGLALTPDDTAADVAFVAPDTASIADGVPDVYAIAPQSAAVGLGASVPDGLADYVAAVRPQADAWAGVTMPAGADDACLPGLTRGEPGLTRGEVVARAGGLDPGTRLLTTEGWRSPEDWVTTVLAPVAARGSVVFVVNSPDDATVERRMIQERATVRR